MMPYIAIALACAGIGYLVGTAHVADRLREMREQRDRAEGDYASALDRALKAEWRLNKAEAQRDRAWRRAATLNQHVVMLTGSVTQIIAVDYRRTRP